MRVIRQNISKYQPFYQTLKNVENEKIDESPLRLVEPESPAQEEETQTGGSPRLLQYISALESKTKKLSNPDEIINILDKTLRRIISVNELSIFYYNDMQNTLSSRNKNASSKTTAFINSTNKDGILEWIFETGKPVIIPEPSTQTIRGTKNNYLIIPIVERKVNRGVVSILTSINSLPDESAESQAIRICLGIVLPQLEIIRQKQQLTSTFHDLQVYQSKLTNDFKLSAIGELTSGIAETLISPLQVIMSYTDMIGKEFKNVDRSLVNGIMSQVKKVNTIVSRLVKFASLDSSELKIQPCDLNRFIEEYQEVIASSLRNKNYECILDLEERIPPILSNENYVNQILSNAFSVLRATNEHGGGILIQSKFIKDNIVIRFISTDYLEKLSKSYDDYSRDISFRILKNLMSAHEGEIVSDATETTGSTLVLSFPLKRKIRK